jgi:hypothetical protein
MLRRSLVEFSEPSLCKLGLICHVAATIIGSTACNASDCPLFDEVALHGPRAPCLFKVVVFLLGLFDFPVVCGLHALDKIQQLYTYESCGFDCLEQGRY